MDNRLASPQKPKERLVRVFISSTFRDMQEERDYLVKHVFPELRRRCRERQVEFVEVDLRWGVTEEQSIRGEVLPICLAEIERCRPYFIGLLGERYGWVPESVDQVLMQEHPWLAEHREHSVTALEIIHGVLNSPEMASRSHFYFRDPAYVEKIPSEHRGDFLSEDATARAKLEHLKARIRTSGLPVKENYPDPEAVGQYILEDLWAAIDKEYPAAEAPDPLDREAQEHEAFAASRAKVYVGRPEYFQQLTGHAIGEGLPLVLLGESGVGKSALLANWVVQYRQQHLDDFVFLHFIGSTPQSTDYVALLHRLLSELKRRFPEQTPEEVPAQPEKLREALPLWLAGAAAAGQRLIIILDALNQLEDRDSAPDLGWLPEYFPSNVRVILSTLPGRPLEALKKRNWPTLTIAGLQPAAIRQVIPAYLAQYRKTLEPRLLERLIAAPQCVNPLFLRALLEELRVFGVHEALDQRLAHYLGAPTIEALYARILARLEGDYEKERPGLVGEALTCLWAARQGLFESELLELLGSPAGPLPRAYWSPLHLALEESLVSRSGLLGFFHDYLRQAVQQRYLTTPEAERDAHRRLADYFENRDLDDRQVDELPWQLEKAQKWDRLKDCLTDLEIFLKLLTEAKRYELMGYWLALRERYDLVAAYQAALDRYQQSAPSDDQMSNRLHLVAFFLGLNAQYAAAEPLHRRALALYEKVLGPEHPNVAFAMGSLANLYIDQGRYRAAEPLYQRALAIVEKVLGPEHPDVAISLNNLAMLYGYQGRYPEAEPLCRRALALREKVLGPEHPEVASSLNILVGLYDKQGLDSEAEPLCRRDLAIREKALGPQHPKVATSLNNLAELYRKQGRYLEAEPLYQRALAIVEKVLGPEDPHVATTLDNLAMLYYAQDRYGEAEPLYWRILAIYKKVLGSEHPDMATSLNNLAMLYYVQGRYGEAEPLYQRSLSIQEQVLGLEHPEVATCLNNLAGLYHAQARYPEAEPLYRRALAIREKVPGPVHPEVATSLNNLAMLYYVQGRYGEAEPLYQRSLSIQERVLGPEHPHVATCLYNLAGLYHAQARYPEAEPLYRRALAIQEKVLGSEHPDVATALTYLANLYNAQDRYTEAEPLYQRSLAIQEKVLGSEHPHVADYLYNLAVLYQAQAHYPKAEPLYRRSLAIQEKVLGPEHPHVAQSLNNLANLYYTQGRYREAEPLYQRALAIYKKVQGPEHQGTITIVSNLAQCLQRQDKHQKSPKSYWQLVSAQVRKWWRKIFS